MALIAAHLNAGHSGGDIVVIGINSLPLPPPLYALHPFSPSLISLMATVDVKHHVYLLTCSCHPLCYITTCLRLHALVALCAV